jgi:hypothetical protein
MNNNSLFAVPYYGHTKKKKEKMFGNMKIIACQQMDSRIHEGQVVASSLSKEYQLISSLTTLQWLFNLWIFQLLWIIFTAGGNCHVLSTSLLLLLINRLLKQGLSQQRNTHTPDYNKSALYVCGPIFNTFLATLFFWRDSLTSAH